MKKNIRKLINVLIALVFLYSCNWKTSTEYKAKYLECKLKPEIEELVALYIVNHPKLNSKNYDLELSVLDKGSKEYYLRLDNIKKAQNGYKEELTKSWRVVEHEGFKVYVLDESEKISKTIDNKITIVFSKVQDSIVPDMYNGNPWEIQFRNDSVVSLHFMEHQMKKEILRKLDSFNDSILNNRGNSAK